MPPLDGPKQTQSHFRSTSVQQAILALHQRYPDPFRKSGHNKTFLKLFQIEKNSDYTDELMSLGYGKLVKADDGAQRFEIGLVGKMWALLCLLPLSEKLQEDAGKSPLKAAYSILKHRVEKVDAVRLSLLIKLATTNYSDANNRLTITPHELSAYYENVKAHAARCLVHVRVFASDASAAARLNELLDQSFPSPETCAAYLYKALGLQECERGPSPEAEKLGPLHDFEPVLQQFIDNEIAAERESDTDIEDALNQVLTRLENYEENPRKPHIALLLGDEQSGKKSVVGDLLRRLRAQCIDDAPITLPVRYASKTKMRLPILALSIRNHDYGSLCSYVLAFLMRANEKLERDANLAHHARLLKQLHMKGGSLDELLRLIEIEHKENAALFVFLDAQGLDRDSLERVLQNSGLYRLMSRLWRSNRQSRYIITTTAVDHAYAPRDLSLRRAIVQVPRPQIDRFAWYLSTGDLWHYRQPDAKLTDERGYTQSLEEALNAFAASLEKGVQVSGDILLSLSALYGMGVRSRAFYEVCQLYLKDQASIGVTTNPAGEAQIYKALVDEIDNLGILLPITLIAATRFTEDVLTTASLKELCRRYFMSSSPEEFLDYWSEAIRNLEHISDGARTLFLSRYHQVRTDPEELGYQEERQERGDNWYMSSAVATSILEALLADDAHHGLAKDAFRLIATASRRKAQLKRMRRSEDASSSDRGEIARDIQCFVALLASLPNDYSAIIERGSESATNRALRLSLDEVFTIGSTFDPVHALRFAVQCVLRQDIDEGYRLSMVTDQDELRLKLYLLIFFSTGQLHIWTISHLRNLGPRVSDFLPEKIPTHVTELFETQTQIDLLLTVALAAYHSQLPHVVAWALEMSHQVECATSPRERHRQLAMRARIASTVIDAGIASGKNIVDGGNLNDVLAWTIDQSKTITSEIGFDPLGQNADVASLLPDKLKLVQSRMRLAAREAELNWIACNDLKAARRTYERLECLEHLIARYIDHSEPVVLSGRTARRFARLLCRDYPVFAEPWFSNDIRKMPDNVTRKVRHVIEANIGRLNHYAGADRIGVLVDQARRHSVARDYELALDYIKDAHDRLENSKISHGGRLDLLGVKAGVHLTLGECALLEGAPVGKHLKAANTHIKTLVSVSKSLKYDCPMVVGKFLRSRSQILENASKGDDLLSHKAEKLLESCIEDAKKSGYLSAEAIALKWKALAKARAE